MRQRPRDEQGIDIGRRGDPLRRAERRRGIEQSTITTLINSGAISGGNGGVPSVAGAAGVSNAGTPIAIALAQRGSALALEAVKQPEMAAPGPSTRLSGSNLNGPHPLRRLHP
jgi:hypothetical protein